MPVTIPLPFKPLDDDYLAIAMSAALGTQPLMPVPPASPIRGVGVYALYYVPPRAPANPLLRAYRAHCVNGGRPLYIGVSVKAELTQADASAGLQNRLRRHGKKLDAGAPNFTAADFRCRVLRCDNRWAALVEHYLIQLHLPLWNSPTLKGFGSNVRGAGRAAQAPSQWEVLHQGMASTAFTAAAITADATTHLTATAVTPFYKLDDTP